MLLLSNTLSPCLRRLVYWNTIASIVLVGTETFELKMEHSKNQEFLNDGLCKETIS